MGLTTLQETKIREALAVLAVLVGPEQQAVWVVSVASF